MKRKLLRLQVAVFIAAVYKMFDALSAFIKDERIRSSSKSLTDVIDEWENVFAKDVNLILLKCFMKFVQGSGECSTVLDKIVLKSKLINFVLYVWVVAQVPVTTIAVKNIY